MVSSEGRVRSFLQTSRGRILRPGADGNGRAFVILSNGRMTKNIRIHKLVALTFLGPVPPGLEICHNDGNCKNNYRNNLRYDTRSANMQDKKLHGTNINRNTNKIKCKRNHVFDDANTYRNKNGKRQCRACMKLRGRLYYEANRDRLRLVADNKRRHIVSPDVLERLGATFNDAITVSATEILLHEEGEKIS